MTIARTIWREKGLLGFYEGWEAYPFLSLKPALQETIIDQTRIAWLRWVGRAGLKGSEGFMLGGWGRIVTTLIVGFLGCLVVLYCLVCELLLLLQAELFPGLLFSSSSF